MVERRPSKSDTRVRSSPPARSTYGEGSIRKRGNGYQIRWMVKDPVTGLAKQKSRTIHTDDERVAQRALRDAKLEEFNPAEFTVDELVAKWLDLPSRKSKRSREEQERVVRLHISPAIGHVKARKLTAAQVTALYARMLDDGKSPATIRHVHYVLTPAFRLALDMEWLAKSPMTRARVPELHDPEVVVPRAADVRLALECCDPETRCFAVIAAITGVRRGELCGLQWQDIDWERRVMTIRQAVTEPKGGAEIKPPKTASSVRRLSFNEDCAGALREQYTRHLAYGHLGRLTDYVFASPTSASGERPVRPHRITQAWRTACQRAGVRIRLHDLRHWFASTNISEGADIASLAKHLGHRKTSTTLDVYGHLIEDKGRVMVETASRALGP